MSKAIKIFLFLTLLIGASVSGVALSIYLAQKPVEYVNTQTTKKVSADINRQTVTNIETAEPLPTVSGTVPRADTRFYPLQLIETVNSARSSDGVHTLTLKKVKSERSTKYTATVSKKDDGQVVEIFVLEVNPATDISIPYNAWSPNNEYIYFVTTEGPGKEKKYHVYRAEGDLFASDTKTIEVSSRFYEEVKDHIMTDVTGWGSYGTLIINTDTLQGEHGPSYWYDVPSDTVTRLSIRFD